MKNFIIDERCVYSDYVFGYNDTERIRVRFELPPDSNHYIIKIIESDAILWEKHLYIIDEQKDFQPTFEAAEEILLNYWNKTALSV